MKEPRLGAAGYSMYQPVAQNSSESTRRKNRRVEIFVLAPDASVVGWDPNWAATQSRAPDRFPLLGQILRLGLRQEEAGDRADQVD